MAEAVSRGLQGGPKKRGILVNSLSLQVWLPAS